MDFGAVNWIAVVVAAIASMALGFVWYMALGNQWMAALNKTREQIMASGNQATPFLPKLMTFVVDGARMSAPTTP